MGSAFKKYPGILNTIQLKTLKNHSGAALIAVVITSIILTLGAAGLIVVATSASRNETLSLNDNRAFLAAESGLIMGAKWINNGTNYSTSFGSASDGYVLQNVIPGLIVNTFNVQVDMEKTAAGVLIKSTAQSSGKIDYNKQLTQHASSAKYTFDTTAFDYSIICDGTFNFNGCGTITAAGGTQAAVHSNSLLNVTGNANVTPNILITSSTGITVGNNIINADLTAPVLGIHANATINGTKTIDSVPRVTIPDINLLPFFYEALYNNEVKTGPYAFHGDYQPNGGIVWVNGDVTIDGSKGTSFNGTIIATGNITVSEKIILNPPNGFALASVNGNIHVASSGAINGLVYAKNGNYQQTSNGALNGQLVVKGTIQKGGNSDVVVYNRIIPNNPNTGSATGCKLAAGSWVEQNI